MESATTNGVEEEQQEPQAEEDQAAPEAPDGALFDASPFTLDPGGEKPEESVLILKQGTKGIANELKRGQEVALIVHARVDEVRFKGAKRTQLLEVLDIFEQDQPEPDESATAAEEPEAAAEEVDGEVVEEAEEAAEEPVIEEGGPEAMAEKDLDWE